MKKTLSLAALFLVAMTGSALADADYSASIKAPSAKAGAKAVATISVQPKGPYHINKEFPTKLTIDAPAGVTIEKAKQSAKDAVKFGDTAAEFQVAFTPESAGKKSFTGELRFAVCEGEKACVPKTEKISFTVDVK
jgi:hypothetical protein